MVFGGVRGLIVQQRLKITISESVDAELSTAEYPAGDPNLKKILELLREASEFDFSHYKANTLYRRITRRMALQKIEGLKDYARFLQENPDEVEALHRDILVNVTSFFRNAEVFELLKAKIFPQLFKDRSRHDPLRAWVLGCSTGEEAYSIAMTFVEFQESTGSHVPVQVFATDLNGTAIEKARAGVYSKSITNDVSLERLRRFFVEVDGSYRVTKPIRDMCILAKHNVVSDPPFSRLDLDQLPQLAYLPGAVATTENRATPALCPQTDRFSGIGKFGRINISSVTSLCFAKKNSRSCGHLGIHAREVVLPQVHCSAHDAPAITGDAPEATAWNLRDQAVSTEATKDTADFGAGLFGI